MNKITIALVALLVALMAVSSIESLPFDVRIVLIGAAFCIAAMLIGGVVLATIITSWETLEKDRRHGP